MTENQVISALGDGWLGKGVAAVVAAAAAWFIRRPVAHAAIMQQVDARISNLMDHQAEALSRATADLARERERCDQELAAMRAEIAAFRGRLRGRPGPRKPRAPKG